MDSTNIICPVCTLYLRPGITLKQHLSSHPKQKVIEALVKLSGGEETQKVQSIPPQPDINAASSSQVNTAIVNQSWNQAPQGQLAPPPPINPIHGNHVFIYQQSMSTTSPQPNVLNVNPLSQQYVYPTVFNPQMMPYVYQQQQVIMSSNSLPPHIRALPFELPSTSQSSLSEVTVQNENENNQSEDSRIVEVQGNNEESAQHDETLIKESFCSEEPTIKKQEVLDANNDVKTMEDFENEQLILNEIPSEGYNNENNGDYDHAHVDHEECIGSPHSQSNSDWGFHSDLNKACQTQITTNTSPRSQILEDEDEVLTDNQDNHEDQPEYFYLNQQNEEYMKDQNEQNNVIPYTTVKVNTNAYEQSEPIYTSANILHGGDQLDFVNMEDIVIISDFSSNQVISQVENFENTSPDRPGVLMTIGDIVEQPKNDFIEQRDLEESMSRESSHVNIRSDERMPARGELSGQESIGGASDITWNRMQYQEGSSGMSHSYDLIGRETWEASDSDSVEVPTLQRRTPMQLDYHQNEFNENENDTPTIVGYSGPPLNFKCPTCGDAFSCSKERKEHEIEKHPEKTAKTNMIGSEIGKKKVKKLVVKLKSDKTESENNFDNVFTNKLKLEATVEAQADVTVDNQIKVDELNLELKDLKTFCPICDCVVENAKALKIHKLEVHKESADVRHKCLTCGEAFPNEYKYTEHLKIHPLECRLCGKLFYRRQNIQLHMKRHLGLKPYKCEVCQKSFVTRQKHDEHKNIHTGEAPIKCNLCDETFRRHSNLVQHRNRHHFQMKKKVKDYICQCGEIFHSKKKLAWHKEIHDSKPKACTQCSEKFVHMSSLTRHMRRAHNEKFLPQVDRDNENVECPICKGTYLRSSLEVHIRNHSGQRPFTCLICNKDFTTKWNLKLHKWTHASRTSKPFKCDQCKGAFIRESDYIAHMNSHKSVRPYTCNYCGAQFIRKYNCLRHVKEHENNKTFNCQVCGKSFHRSYYLKDHMRVHSGIRPYSCHICGKTSTTKSNHNKHVQIHHAREPVSTEN
ncbi:hypothetical protein NQ314_006295 [Rhamnusium bicolor]|uniref:C2H2-type domain-containing protein n=1 Tax=Rhamnusium bicolor TaxID=1586634 RepID=A0AAV8Z7Q9_9CUCU|nr:hypothetical protein NQ314_006295 [Rhamnusium bicolor]